MNILSLRLKFGQTYSNILLGTAKGFMMYNINNGGLEKMFINNINNSNTKGSGIGLYDNLENTNIALVVGGGECPVAAPNRVILMNTQKKLETLSTFPNMDSTNETKDGLKKITIMISDKILNAFVIRESDGENDRPQIIVVIRREIYLYAMNGDLIASKKTCDNPKGLCSVVSSKSPIIPLTIGYPGVNTGEVVIWRPAQDSTVVIKAHDNDITNISLSFDGKQVVTTSKNATNVHVYSTSLSEDNGNALLHKFRRNTNFSKILGETQLLGDIQQNTQILNVCISYNKEYVACCSESGTIHIFDTKSSDDSQNKPSTFSFFNAISKYFDSKWAMHTISIGIQGNMVCGFDKNNNLHIVSYNGDYFFLSEKNNFVPKSHSLNMM